MARVVPPVLHVVILEFALARLVAYGAVQGVVGQQELQHRAAVFEGLGRARPHDHPFGHRGDRQVLQDVADPQRQNLGFTGAWPGNHKNRSIDAVHGVTLLLIQAIKGFLKMGILPGFGCKI